MYWGEKVYLQFRITQHSKDLELMQLFIKFFNIGKVAVRSNTSTPRCDFIVQDAATLLNIIIPRGPALPSAASRRPKSF